MHQIKNIIYIFSMLLLFSCIKEFDPQIDSNVAIKYVVSGRIIGTEGWQVVDVSISSPIQAPEYIPVSDCQVTILDDKGNVFLLEENNPGQYRVWIGQEYLTPGTSYQVKVTVPTGEELVSGFDRMGKGHPIDSVYYIIEDVL